MEPVGTRGPGCGKRVGRHGEQLLESSASGERPLLRGCGRDAEERREFRIREVAEVVECDHRALGFGQRLDRGPHVVLFVGRGDERSRIPRARVGHFDAVDRADREPLAAPVARARGADQRREPAGERVGVSRGRRACGTRARTLPGPRRARHPSRPSTPWPCPPRSPGSARRGRTRPRCHPVAPLRRPPAGSFLAASCPCTPKEPPAAPAVTAGREVRVQ